MSLFDAIQSINIRLQSSNLGKQIIEKWENLKKDKDAEYFVRRHINQFMGVISINDLNNRQLMGPFAPGFLNEEIYNLFLHSHLQLVQMNKRCLASVENIIPGFFNLVTFYDGIAPEVDKKFTFDEMFTSQELDELSRLIENTEPIKNLVALLPQFKGQDTTNLENSIWNVFTKDRVCWPNEISFRNYRDKFYRTWENSSRNGNENCIFFYCFKNDLYGY